MESSKGFLAVAQLINRNAGRSPQITVRIIGSGYPLFPEKTYANKSQV